MAESDDNSRLEIGHVLFLDIVGYSKLLNEDQKERLNTLTAIVLATPAVQQASDEQLVRLPTGDGMALVFRHSAEEPARCALEIAEALRKHPELPVRMGIHSGPVSKVTDVSGRKNLAGVGINMAQRVMDCGDAGHILLSQHVADDLVHSRQWAPRLRDLGECEVKHGVRLHLVNLYAEPLGNPEPPTKFKQSATGGTPSAASKPRGIGWQEAVIALLLGAVIVGVIILRQRTSGTASTSTTTPPVAEKSIAVLPFENLSDDKSNAYFAEGVQDEILTRLANLRELKVISRTSTVKYQSHPANLKTIAAELGVANILEGSVQRLGNDVHINAQLIKASTDEHLWAESFDRTMEHAFAVEGEVAQKVADALKLTLAPAQVAKLKKAPTENAKAYDLFLRGEYEMHRAWADSAGNSETAAKAASYYQEAAQLDPEFVLAIASLGRAQLSEYYLYTEFKGPEGAPQTVTAKANIDRAISLAPDLALGHLAFGEWYLWIKRDHPNAIKELQRALELDRNLADAQTRLCAVWRRENQPEKAIVALREALEIDPRNIFLHRNLAFAYEMLRRYKLAAASLARAVVLEPSDTIDSLNLAEVYSYAGDLDAAGRTLDTFPPDRRTDTTYYFARRRLLRTEHDFQGMAELLKAMPESGLPQWVRLEHEGDIALGLGQTDLARERFEGARALVADVLAKNDKEAGLHSFIAYLDARLHHAPEAIAEAKRAVDLAPEANDSLIVETALTQLATIYSLLAQRNEAIEVLQRVLAMPSGDVISPTDLKRDPDWDPIRDDPRFQKLIASAEQSQ